MAVPAIVSLHAVRQRVALRRVSVQRNLTGKNGIGMSRSRESDPTLAAELRVESGAVAQIPTDAMAVYIQMPAAFVLGDAVFTRLKEERARAVRAQAKVFEPEALDPGHRFSRARKPGGPHLHGAAAGFAATSTAAGTREQVAKPPRAVAVGKSHAQKPNFVAAPHGELRVEFVEREHRDENSIESGERRRWSPSNLGFEVGQAGEGMLRLD